MQATVACCNLLLLYSLLQLLQPAGAAACSLLGLIAAACCRSVCNLLLPCCLPTVDVLHTAAGCCLQPVLRYSLTAACLQTADAVCLQPTDATCLQSADAAVCGLSAACLQSAAVLFAACCCCCLLAVCRCLNMQSAAACQQPVLPTPSFGCLLAACWCCCSQLAYAACCSLLPPRLRPVAAAVDCSLALLLHAACCCLLSACAVDSLCVLLAAR